MVIFCTLYLISAKSSLKLEILECKQQLGWLVDIRLKGRISAYATVGLRDIFICYDMSDWTAIKCCIYWLRDNRLHIAPQSIMTAVIYDVCDVIGKEELTSMFKINKKW